GHHLDDGDAQISESRKLLRRRRPRAFRRERSDVELVDHLACRADAIPVAIGPCKRTRVHQSGWTMRAVRLKARHGIGPQAIAIDPEPIAIERRKAVDAGFEESVTLAREGK